MKSFKLITAALALAAIVLSGCQGDSNEPGVDSSMPVPNDLTYDETNSSATVLAVYWDAREALAAGATSFTIQIPPTLTGGDNYDSKVAQTLSKDKICDAASFSGLTTGSACFIRVRANYPNSVYSKWVYYTVDNEPALYVVGYGFIAQGTFPIPVITSLTATADKITVKWPSVYGADGYTVEYKKTESSTWIPIDAGNVTTYDIENLDSETSYDVRIQGYAATSGKTSEYSEVSTTSTLKKATFPMDISTADQLVAALTGSELITGTAADVVNITADIDLSGKTFASSATFIGTLNGNNHTIKNWKGTTPMFASIANAKDLTFDSSCSFTVSSATFGALAATSTGTISNITNKASVTYNLSDAASETIMLAGIVAESNGKMENCKNLGAVTLSAASTLTGTLVAGVVAYQTGETANCTNSGPISLSATYLSDLNSTIGGVAKVPIHTAGVVAMVKSSTITSCSNSGKITYDISAMDGMTVSAGTNRPRIAGVVAAPDGDISSCTNTGDIDVSVVSTTRNAYSTNNFTISVAGISGGDVNTSAQNSSNISDCENDGNIVIDFDNSKSNATAAGIVGYPAEETSGQTVVISNCTNKGNITMSGSGKMRVGGITGGIGNVDGCKNYGTITNNLKCSACCIGGISGFSSQNLKFTNCYNYGDVINASSNTTYVGGLIGNYGNVVSNIGAGCIVKCTVSTAGDATYAGMVIGYYNGTNAVVFGSTDSKVKVGGTFVTSAGTTVLTSSNFSSVLKGTNANGAAQVVNAEFGE